MIGVDMIEDSYDMLLEFVLCHTQRFARCF